MDVFVLRILRKRRNLSLDSISIFVTTIYPDGEFMWLEVTNHAFACEVFSYHVPSYQNKAGT